MLFWMFGALVFLLIIDIIILAVWETNDPMYRTLKQVRSQPEYECFQVSHVLKQVDYQKANAVRTTRPIFEPWRRTLYCVIWKDTFLSQCFSPPSCING